MGFVVITSKVLVVITSKLLVITSNFRKAVINYILALMSVVVFQQEFDWTVSGFGFS